MNKNNIEGIDKDLMNIKLFFFRNKLLIFSIIIIHSFAAFFYINTKKTYFSGTVQFFFSRYMHNEKAKINFDYLINSEKYLASENRDTQSDIDANRGNIEDAQANIGADQGNIEDAQANIGADQGNIEDAQANIGADQGNIEDAQANIGADQDNIEVAQGNIENAQDNFEAAQANTLDFLKFQNIVRRQLSPLAPSDYIMNIQKENFQSKKILDPIFEKTRLEKSIRGETIEYEEWRNNLNYEIKKKLGILNVSYRDTNKNDVYFVLKEIGDSFFNVFREWKVQNFNREIKSMQNLADLYRKKSVISKNELKRFIENLDESNEELNISEIYSKKIKEFNILQKEAIANQLTSDELEKLVYEVEFLKNKNDNEFEEIILGKPKLDEKPIAPNKKKIIALFLFWGFIFGTLISFIKEISISNIEKK